MANFITGTIVLNDDQIQTVKQWLDETSKTKSVSSNSNNGWWFGEVPNEVLVGQKDPETLIFLREGFMEFQQVINEELFNSDTMFGLDKGIFLILKRTQLWKNSDDCFSYQDDEPVDPNNWIKYKLTFSPFYSRRNRDILETEKAWKDRVFSIDLLKERMKQAISSSNCKMEDLLNTASSQAEEYHQPISIKMILDHLNNPSISELINDILTETIKSNIIRKENLDAFINTVNQFKLKRDIEIDGITAAYATSSDGKVTDIRDIPDAIEATNGITSEMKRENRLANKTFNSEYARTPTRIKKR